MSPEVTLHMLQEAPDALLAVDGAGRICFANDAAVRLFGYPEPELLGKGIEALMPERFRAQHAHHRRAFREKPATREMGARAVTLVARRRDGCEFPVEIRLAPIDTEGEALVVAAVRDVSERHRMIEELQAARRSAEMANQSKGRFLAAASHDLRQPLQTLRLLNAAVRHRIKDSVSLDALTRQDQALDVMTDLLNALLDISKLESGTVKPEVTDVAVAQIFAELREQFETVAAARGLALRIEPCEDCLRTDRVLLRELIHNLVSNAIKYTDQGGVIVRCVHRTADVSIEIQDTGVGISEENIGRIFDEYYQAGDLHSGRTGFGLGLTIVKHISRLLGFGIDVRSMPGEGTTFRVSIPSDYVVAGAAPASAIAEATRGSAATLKPALLIIEDDAAVRAALELLLRLEGYTIRSADTGQAAEDIFRRDGESIDMVISDFHLDGPRNGLQVLEALREQAHRDLPAVFLSGDTSSIMQKLRNVPRCQILNKPVEVRHLVASIEGLFAGGDGAPQPAP